MQHESRKLNAQLAFAETNFERYPSSMSFSKKHPLSAIAILVLAVLALGTANASDQEKEVKKKRQDDLATSIKNSASDVDLATRKAIRWTKKQGRKLHGEDSADKSAADAAANARDEANNQAQKAENRAKAQ